MEVLSQLISVHGAPKILRSDHGPEFVSRALLRWTSSQNLDMALIDPGKPWQKGTTESFNGNKFQDEWPRLDMRRGAQPASPTAKCRDVHCPTFATQHRRQMLHPS